MTYRGKTAKNRLTILTFSHTYAHSTPFQHHWLHQFAGFTGFFSAVLQYSSPSSSLLRLECSREKVDSSILLSVKTKKWILVYTAKRCGKELQLMLALKEYSLSIFVSCHPPVLTPHIRKLKNSTQRYTHRASLIIPFSHCNKHNCSIRGKLLAIM